MSDSSPERLRIRFVLPGIFGYAVAAVTGWALLANLARIGYPAQAFDEPFYAQAAWRYVHGDGNRPPTGVLSNYDNFEHPPLAKYLFGIAQLFAGHPSVVADRVVAALFTLGSAAVVGVWLGRVAGRWVGLGGAALIAVLPMSVRDFAFRFGRYGYLDPVAELFAIGSVALAWVWFRRNGRAAWWFALATGSCVGLAAASKENGFLGAVGPVLAGVALVGRDLRALAVRLLQTLTAVIASGVVFAATYLGLGHPIGAFQFMLRSQQAHARFGHRVAFAGRVALHPPGWAFLWFAKAGLGTVLTVFCLACAVAAVVLRRDRLVLWCVAALVGPLIFHMAIARIVLSFYWAMWMPAFLALVALGVAELIRRARGHWRQALDARSATGVAGALCVAVFGLAAAQDTYRMLSKPVPSRQSIAYSDGVLAHAPLVYLRLDQRSGVLALDSTAFHHDGVYVNAPRLGAKGLISSEADDAVTFDGASQYVHIEGAPWMNVEDYTIAVWFRTTARNRYLVARDRYSSGKVWDLLVDRAGRLEYLTFRPFDGAGQPVTSRIAYDDGHPHMVVCTKSGPKTRLYVDGILVAAADYSHFAANTGDLGIDLARRGNGIGYLPGTLDDFAFYGKALSALDVVGLYQAASAH